MQIASVETNAGTAICCAPSRMACFSSFFMRQIAFNVLDFDGGVVHQNAHRQRQTAQGHDVEGLAQRAQQRSPKIRIESGIEMAMISVVRQFPRNSRIMAAVRQAAISAFAHHSLNRRAHEQGLIEQQVHLADPAASVAAICGSIARTFLTMSRVEAPPFFMNAQQRAAHPVLPHDVGLRREAVAHVGHVANVDGRAVHRLDRQIVQLGDRLRTGIQFHLVFEWPELRRAGRQNQVLRADRVDHIHRRQMLGLQRWRVEVDRDQPAACRRRDTESPRPAR